MKQVILIRADLKMGKGKIAAQSAHASIAAMEKSKSVNVNEWKMTGQKKVVLKVTDLDEMLDLKRKIDKLHIPNALITDSGKTQVDPGTITALGIGPDDEKKIDKVTGKLKML